MLYNGRDGYRVRWIDRTDRIRSFFVLSRHDAMYVRQRAKNDKLPGARCWAVRV